MTIKISKKSQQGKDDNNILNVVNMMDETRKLGKIEVISALSKITDSSKSGVVCPVLGCPKGKTVAFKRWGDMRTHFLDETTHKKDYFALFEKQRKEPFCNKTGPGFNHGVNSLILALFRCQANSLRDVCKPLSSMSVFVGSAELEQNGTKNSQETVGYPILTSRRLDDTGAAIAQQTPIALIKEKEQHCSSQPYYSVPALFDHRSRFQILLEMIRQHHKINKVWRGQVYDDYINMFHGIPPCFHCRVAEGKQIHHQNPLFYEIVLICLNKLGTTAEKVLSQLWPDEEHTANKSNDSLFLEVVDEVFNFHMKKGAVCAVPYCHTCNQDAENKRKMASPSSIKMF